MIKRSRYKYYNKQITTYDSNNVQSHDQEESELNSTINVNISAHSLSHNEVISQFNKNEVTTVKANKSVTKIFLLGPVKQVQWCQCNAFIQRWVFSYH